MVNDLSSLNVNFPEYVKCDDDVFTAEMETRLVISHYRHHEKNDEDKSSKNEEQVAVLFFQSALNGFESVKSFFFV